MDMCTNKAKTAILLVIPVILCVFWVGCGPIDSLFNSAGNYKINVQINDIPLDELSFARSSDKIRPYFEHSVSKDPDITALMVYLRKASGEIVGWKVIYKLDEEAGQDNTDTPDENDDETVENKNTSSDDKTADSSDENQNENDPETNTETKDDSKDKNTASEPEKPDPPAEKIMQAAQYKNGAELIIPVKSFDNLPPLPIPDNLPMGSYVIVTLVMNDDEVLQRMEKLFYFLNNIDFSYNSIHAHLPGIAESNQLIPTETIIMLEADLKYDSKLDPFIEWYDGKKKIAEGKASDGMANFFWTAPEESGFYSIRAVVFPVNNNKDLSGYQKELTLVVSSNPIEINMLKETIPYKNSSLTNWYVFESNLNDSRKLSAAEQSDAKKINEERSLKHSKNAPVWKAADGTYGVSTGNNNIISAPKVLLSDNERQNWQLLFRFKQENDGGILSVQFGKSNYVYIHSYIESSNLFLTLTSAAEAVTQIYSLNKPVPEETEDVLAEEHAENTNHQDDEKTWGSGGSFITAGIMFSIQQGILSARLNILGDSLNNELDGKPITIEAEIKNEFQIMLGFLQENIKPADKIQTTEIPAEHEGPGFPSGSAEEASGKLAAVRHEYTALWDEFALYRMP